MTEPPPLRVLVAAVLLGILSDALLRGTPWGINLTLCALALAVAAPAALESRRAGIRDRHTLVWAAAVAALAVAWRDAPLLVAADVLAATGLLGLALIRARGVRLDRAPVRDLLVTGARAAGGVAAGAFTALTAPRPAASPALTRRLRAVTVGVVLALPLAAVFGVLLAGADPRFERALRTLFRWDAEEVASHVVLAGVFACLSLGFLVSLAPRDALPASALARTARLGLVELGIPLGVLATLFAVFVGFQVPYLFGGADVVRSTAGLGFADYARRGFFELVTVTALIVPVLVGGEGVLDRTDPRAVRGFRVLAVVLLGLVSLIAASAVFRLWLYYDVYGLTDDRLYAAAVMLWVGLVLGWFALTVLRGRRGPFALGAIVSGLGVLACLNLINPEGLVARVNLARGRDGADLDVEYLARLGADAAPNLVAGLPDLSAEAQCTLAGALAKRWGGDGYVDWRTWSWARARARRLTGRMGSVCSVETGSAAP